MQSILTNGAVHQEPRAHVAIRPTEATPAVEPMRPESPRAIPARRRSNFVTYMVVVIVSILTWLLARAKFYTPGDDFGYYLGLVGAIMMLLLLLYPLRKHVSFLNKLGEMRHWFRFHMLFGIGGPMLILIHSKFTIGSLNAGIAMGCMLLVAGSGVVGRFMYRRIHHGLYGRRATVQDLQAQLGICEGEVRSKFHFVPEVEAKLKAFGELAHQHPQGFLASSWQFMTLSLQAQIVHARCVRDIKKKLGQHAAQRGWPKDKLRRRVDIASGMIMTYLTAVRHTAQFGVYERLFSLWHVLHVPFVFMLVISGVVHVVAVHMY